MRRLAESDEVAVGPGMLRVNLEFESWGFENTFRQLAQACHEGYLSGMAAAKQAAMKQRNAIWQEAFLAGFLASSGCVGLFWLITEMLR